MTSADDTNPIEDEPLRLQDLVSRAALEAGQMVSDFGELLIIVCQASEVDEAEEQT